MAFHKPASPLPSVDRVLRLAVVAPLLGEHGRSAVVDAVRAVLDGHRARADRAGPPPADDTIVSEVGAWLKDRAAPALRRVLNLTGTVLHTNLGRASLSEAAIEIGRAHV